MGFNPFKRKGPADAQLIKLYDELSAADFEKYPAWIESHVHDFGNPIYEDLDEEAVRPWDGEYPVPLTTCCMFRATFQTTSGLKLAGVVRHWSNTGSKDHCILEHFPCLYLPNGKTINFWHGGASMFGDQWLEADKDAFYANYDLTPGTSFPLSYSVPDSLISGGIKGSIPGFGFFNEKKDILFTT